MRNLRTKWLAIAALILLCNFGATNKVQAAQAANFDLTTSPVYISLNTKPGQAVSTPLKVQNNAANTVSLNVNLMKFKAYAKNGQAQLLPPAANDASANWVSFSKRTIVAEPGQWNTITMTIKPDQTAAFGYYYAVVFTPSGSTKPAENINSVSGSTAVLVLLDVQVPGEKRQLSVANFKSTHKIYEFLPASFEVTVKNTGDVHAIPTGDISISRNRTTDLATLPVNTAGGNVLPGGERTFTVNWDDGFPAHKVKRLGGQVVTGQDGQPVTSLSWEASKLNKFRFGKYYAQLYFVYNNGTQDVPIEAEISFWVIPWKVLLVGLAIIGLLLFGLITFVRKLLRAGHKTVKRGKKPPKV